VIELSRIPQAGLPDAAFDYAWRGRVLTATLYHVERGEGGAVVRQTPIVSEDFDFSGLAAGDVAQIEPQVLPVNPVVSALCDESGDLHVQVVRWYDPQYEAAPTLEKEVLDG